MSLIPYMFSQNIEAGVDEAGRGALAGPVVAAAVILPKGFSHPDLNDSKKLSVEKRRSLEKIILAETFWAIGEADAAYIDRMNILRATFFAMHQALDALSIKPERLLIDGNRFIPYQNIDFFCVIKGDGKYQSIAAASILAKNHRDRLLERKALDYPLYQWEENKGYGTKTHIEKIQAHGICTYHRKSFCLEFSPKQYLF